MTIGVDAPCRIIFIQAGVGVCRFALKPMPRRFQTTSNLFFNIRQTAFFITFGRVFSVK